MKAERIITLEDGQKLNNPTMVLGENITYPQSRNVVIIECIFTEENGFYPNSRFYEFDTNGEQWIKPDIMNAMSKHEELKHFK